MSYSFYLGKEVALYVKDRFLIELQKNQSFKNKDYANALKETFIKMDDLLKSP
jgi:protein phosphatase 1G